MVKKIMCKYTARAIAVLLTPFEGRIRGISNIGRITAVLGTRK